MNKKYFLIALLAVLTFSCNRKSRIGRPDVVGSSAMKPLKVTDNSFEQEVLASELPVVVDFWASWCGPCRQMEPDIIALTNEYKGRVKFVKVDADRNTLTTYQYDVNSLPTVLYFKNGAVTDSSIGLTTKGTIKNKIEGLLRQ